MIDLSESTNRYYHSSIANETSFPSPFALSSKTFFLKSYHSLYRYDWTLYDLQYLFLSILGIFLFYLIEVSGIIKVSVILLLSIGLCYSTKTRSFLLPFLPVATWLMLFYSCRFIPETKRPHIYVSVLPTLENILYGDNISVIMARNTNTTKDIFAWIPYGILHFSLPFLTSFGIWIYGIKGILPVFSRAFGYMNIVGVLTQLVFPCSPPWYEHVYGIETPASYSMPGEPGGLKRIDQLFDVNIYEKAFSGSPMVFGAFPSLHSACAVLQMVFIAYTLQNRKRNYMIYFLGFSYVIWIWWACMYLTHHYMVDLVGGGIYAMITFWFSWKWLPQIITIESRIVVIGGGDDEDNVIDIIVDENDIGNGKNINDNDEWSYEEIIFAINDDIDDDDNNNNNNINDNTDDDNNDVFVLDNASKGNGRIGIGSDCRTG